MAPAARTVRHLRLRGPSEAAVRRTAGVLEDALRTASLPDGGGRIVLVRRLSLGVIDSRAPSTSVALQLERALARADVEVVHGAAPGAAAAPVVWFRDALDAHAALARRVASGPPPVEWYWPLAVPRWTPRLDRIASLRAVAASLAERPEAPAALPAWAAELASRGLAEVVATALRPADLPFLARAAGVRVEGGRRGREARRAEPGGRGWGTAASAEGPSTGGVGVGPRHSPAGVDPEVWSFVRRLAAAGGVHVPAPGGPPVRPPGGAVVPRPGGAPPARVPGTGRPGAGPSVDDAPLGARAPGPGRARGPEPVRPAERAPGDRAHSGSRPPAGRSGSEAIIPDDLAPRPVPAPGSAPPPLPAATAAAGLLFLVGVLERLGYPAWLEARPAWAREDVARRVLAAALARSGVPPEDPAWALVATRPARGPGPGVFVAPAAWRDGLLSGDGPLLMTEGPWGGRLHDPSGRLLLAGWRGRPPDAVASERAGAARPDASAPPERPTRPLRHAVTDAWGVAVRRWLRRRAGAGVATVVLRPGGLDHTPTHVDVRLGLDAAELAVRRAGLDVDPGWVPWLGRVVAFHYGRQWT